MKTLLIVTPERRYVPLAERTRREAADEHPQELLLEETLHADVLNAEYLRMLRSRSLFMRLLSKILPLSLLQALIAYRMRHRYDVVVSWNNRVALIYAFLLRLTRSRARHVAILCWVVPQRTAFILKLFQKGIDRIILRSQTERDLLVELGNISPERIVLISHQIDHTFWRPMDEIADSICSAGDSRRDYATLIEAMRGLDIRCNIATRVEPGHAGTGDWGATGGGLAQVSSLPDNVICKPASATELRTLYARALFVVIPVFPTFRDNGITVVKQAMAMGKAVICTRTQGLAEFLEEGVTGITVPPGDPQALREAIQYLWDHPEVAVEMGREGRRRIEEIFTLTQFVTNVRQVVDDVITGNRTHIPTPDEQMRALRKSLPQKPEKETARVL